MPQWAHYADNHRGICIEYVVENGYSIYPVLYESSRIDATSIIVNYLNQQDSPRDITENDGFLLLMFQGVVKHKSWSYENEFRILFPNLLKKEKGFSVPLVDIGLKINAIYLGIQISDIHMQQIAKVARNLQIKVYQMKIKCEATEYELGYEEVLLEG